MFMDADGVNQFDTCFLIEHLQPCYKVSIIILFLQSNDISGLRTQISGDRVEK